MQLVDLLASLPPEPSAPNPPDDVAPEASLFADTLSASLAPPPRGADEPPGAEAGDAPVDESGPRVAPPPLEEPPLDVAPVEWPTPRGLDPPKSAPVEALTTAAAAAREAPDTASARGAQQPPPGAAEALGSEAAARSSRTMGEPTAAPPLPVAEPATSSGRAPRSVDASNLPAAPAPASASEAAAPAAGAGEPALAPVPARRESAPRPAPPAAASAGAAAPLAVAAETGPEALRPGAGPSGAPRDADAPARSSAQSFAPSDPGRDGERESRGDTRRPAPAERFAPPVADAPREAPPAPRPAVAAAAPLFDAALVRAEAPLAPQPTSAPPPAGSPAEVLPVHVEWLAARGGGAARIHLHPPQLGELEIVVRTRGDAVDVLVRARQPEALRLVKEQRLGLGEALAARELRMEQFEVLPSSPREGSAAAAPDAHRFDTGREGALGQRRPPRDPDAGPGSPGQELATHDRSAQNAIVTSAAPLRAAAVDLRI